nr:hypothetical protein [Rhizobium leguminosarum]
MHDGPKYLAVHYRRRSRSQPLPRRNPQVPDAGAAAGIHARKALC